jgi:hypothetical protein
MSAAIVFTNVLFAAILTGCTDPERSRSRIQVSYLRDSANVLVSQVNANPLIFHVCRSAKR